MRKYCLAFLLAGALMAQSQASTLDAERLVALGRAADLFSRCENDLKNRGADEHGHCAKAYEFDADPVMNWYLNQTHWQTLSDEDMKRAEAFWTKFIQARKYVLTRMEADD